MSLVERLKPRPVRSPFDTFRSLRVARQDAKKTEEIPTPNRPEISLFLFPNIHSFFRFPSRLSVFALDGVSGGEPAGHPPGRRGRGPFSLEGRRMG